MTSPSYRLKKVRIRALLCVWLQLSSFKTVLHVYLHMYCTFDLLASRPIKNPSPSNIKPSTPSPFACDVWNQSFGVAFALMLQIETGRQGGWCGKVQMPV